MVEIVCVWDSGVTFYMKTWVQIFPKWELLYTITSKRTDLFILRQWQVGKRHTEEGGTGEKWRGRWWEKGRRGERLCSILIYSINSSTIQGCTSLCQEFHPALTCMVGNKVPGSPLVAFLAALARWIRSRASRTWTSTKMWKWMSKETALLAGHNFHSKGLIPSHSLTGLLAFSGFS